MRRPDRAQDPRARLYIVDHLAPGTTIHGGSSVERDCPVRHVRLTPGRARLRRASSRRRGDREKQRPCRWTSVSPPAVDVAPRARAGHGDDRGPSSASSGERYGVVWQSSRRAGQRRSLAGQPPGGAHLSVRRPGASLPRASSSHPWWCAHDQQGQPRRRCPGRNTGGRALDWTARPASRRGPGTVEIGVAPLRRQERTLRIGQLGRRAHWARLGRQSHSGSWDSQVQAALPA